MNNLLIQKSVFQSSLISLKSFPHRGPMYFLLTYFFVNSTSCMVVDFQLRCSREKAVFSAKCVGRVDYSCEKRKNVDLNPKGSKLTPKGSEVQM